MASGVLSAFVAAVLVAVGLFAVVRPQSASRWLVFLITLSPSALSPSSAQPKIRSVFIVLVGVIYILIAVCFFVLPTFSTR
jgi:hypothetical protein